MRIPLSLGVAALVAGAALVAIPFAAAGDPMRCGNAKCPVTGDAVDGKTVSTWNGLDVAFCCAECPAKFAADAQAYTPALVRDLATQLADTKARLAKYEKPAAAEPAPAAKPAGVVDLGNATCPVMGGKAKDAVSTEYHGMRVHFCCGGCDRKFHADPAGYLAKMRSDAAVAKKIDQAEKAWAAGHPK